MKSAHIPKHVVDAVARRIGFIVHRDFCVLPLATVSERAARAAIRSYHRAMSGPVVTVISSGPPTRSLSEILRNPPKLKLKAPSATRKKRTR